MIYYGNIQIFESDDSLLMLKEINIHPTHITRPQSYQRHG